MTKTDVFKNLYVEDDKPINSSIKDGYIYDYISGLPVKETPEEIEAVQPFSEILVEDYGYPKACIQTRPQWRVKARPSDNKKEYPVDIAIFSGAEHQDENISIVVECKKKNRKDGRSQLESYLRFSRAMLGVWFNGEERLYLQKIEKNGAVTFREIPNIPRYGERLEDVGKYKRKDLIPSDNLKPTFKTIRNYLAANAVGITRDEVFAAQIINLIFCKIYDERFTRPEETVNFRAGVNENEDAIRKRIIDLFEKVKTQYNDVIEISDTIDIDKKSLTYVVGELQLYSLARCAAGDTPAPRLAAWQRPIHKCILILGHRFAAVFAAVLTLLLLGFGSKNHAHGAGRRTIDEGNCTA